MTRHLLTSTLLASGAVAALLSATPAADASNPFTWQTATPESQGMSRAKLDALKDSLAARNTKAFLVDRRAGFVGSFNLDPRSISLNTEMGLLFADPAIASEMHAIISEQVDADASYRLRLDDGRVRWVDGEETQPRIWTREPEAGITRRVICFVLGLLPIESQL